MAFPGTYDIKYYKGDTFEFFIYPKNSSGNTFDLTGFTDIQFTIAEFAGTAGASTAIAGETDVDGNNTYIKCIITPDIGEQLNASKTYVYDVQIKKPAVSGISYPYIYTILKGNISITEEVTLPEVETLVAPGNVTAFNLIEDPVNADQIAGSWSAPSAGGAVASYDVYFKETGQEYSSPVNVPSSITAFQTFGTPFAAFVTTGVEYTVKVVAKNAAGSASGVEDTITLVA